MKYVLKFILQTAIVGIVFLPFIFVRGVWTLKFHDRIEGMPVPLFTAYRRAWRNLCARFKGEGIHQFI